MIAIQYEPADARAGDGSAPALGAVDWLYLAAAPTFAVMALLTAVLGGGAVSMLCSGVQDASPLTGMVPMYLLMSVFHSAAWLRLIFGRPR
jgi:ABC-type Na+ efflux pump permease subunit